MGTIDIASLSSEERLRLLEEIWESLSETPEAVPLTAAQREELDRRLDELDHEGPTGIPWDDLSPNVPSRYTFPTGGAESSFADVRRTAAWTHGTTPAWCWFTIG